MNTDKRSPQTTKRPPGIFYRLIIILLLFSLLPAFLMGTRMLTLARATLESTATAPELQAAIQATTNAMSQELIAYLFYIALVAAIIAVFISGEITLPILALQTWVEERLVQIGLKTDANIAVQPGDLSQSPELLYPGAQGAANGKSILPTLDDLAPIATNFAQMADHLGNLQQNMVEQIAERTRQLEHRARLQQAAASVAQQAASTRDLDELLNKVTQLISENFEYYHAGIFLIDNNHEYAILRAANSPGGKQMLSRGHKLSLGETSIVGYVASTRQPRIALSVGADAVHFKNPYLPNTRSEMALPLVSGEHLWGVLDVQSTAESAFTEEDIAVLQILANQVAIAIENANLFIENTTAMAELQNTLESSRKLYGELTRDAWRKLLQNRPDLGYICTNTPGTPATERQPTSTLTRTNAPLQPEMLQAMQDSGASQSSPEQNRSLLTGQSNDTLILPLRIRNYTAGVIRLRKSQNENNAVSSSFGYVPTWNQDEIDLMQTITDQLSVALEGARLYDETRRRAERERLTSEITSKVRMTNDPQTILQTAVSELRRALQASRAEVQVTTTGLGSAASAENDLPTPPNSQTEQPGGES